MTESAQVWVSKVFVIDQHTWAGRARACVCVIMGNTVSCCVSPSGSPKLPRQVERLEDYQINTDLSDDTGPYLQHISDREVPDGKF